MKIVIPMAGKGARFKAVGITTPKPFIEVLGKPMLQWSVESVRRLHPDLKDSDLIFVCLKEHEIEIGIGVKIKDIVGAGCTILYTSPEEKVAKQVIGGEERAVHATEGAVTSVLIARRLLDTDEDVAVCDSDQFFDCPVFIKLKEKASKDNWGGIIATFESSNPGASYARLLNEADFESNVAETAEKVLISTHAAIGFYYFCRGRYFLQAADQAIRKDARTRGEFYMCPLYNELIAMGKAVKIAPADIWMTPGTPRDMEYFIQNLPKKYRT
jgi:NDP-sugar pyrophosphorylase family protein